MMKRIGIVLAVAIMATSAALLAPVVQAEVRGVFSQEFTHVASERFEVELKDEFDGSVWGEQTNTHWTKTSGPVTNTLAPFSQATVVQFSTVGDYIFELTIFDNKGNDPLIFVITIHVIEGPVTLGVWPPIVEISPDLEITLIAGVDFVSP